MMPILLAAGGEPGALEQFVQHCLIGLTFGTLIALIALGYTMVYGIIGLINFAHGDLFMLGSFLALSIVTASVASLGGNATGLASALAVVLCLAIVPIFCAGLNVSVDYLVYRPLRTAPKLAPLVSAIGVSFVFMNIGYFWGGAAPVNFPNLVSDKNILAHVGLDTIRFNWKDLLVVGITVPIMVGLTLFVKFTRLGKAMRATEQNMTAAQLMGVSVDRVIAATFGIGGALGGVASVVYALHINTVSFQMGFQNGLYAFTAAVLGGIGNLPGAVLGGLLIGLVRSLGSAYLDERWTNALVFAILITILIFRPQGLLGARAKEKV